MRPNRLFASSSAVLLLAVLIGCGGDSGGGGTIGGNGSTSGTDGGSTPTPVPTGVYAATYTGSDDAAPAVGFSGSGTATVAANGTVTLNYSSVSNGTPPATTSRILTVRPTTATAGTGSLVVGSAAAVPTTVTLARNSGTYQITSRFSPGTGVTQTDVFTLTFSRPADGTYVGTVSGTDNQNGTYTNVGTPTATVTPNGGFRLDYIASRNNVVTLSHSLNSTFATDGTFSGAISLGNDGNGGGSTPNATGTWSLTGNVLTLKVTYVNPNIVDGTGARPTVKHTLVLTKQS